MSTTVTPPVTEDPTRATTSRSVAALPPDLANPRRRWALGLSLSLLSGLLLVWSMEGYHVGELIWVGFVPALVAQHRVLPARWSGIAFGIAVGVLFQGYLGPGLADGNVAWYLKIYGLWIAILVSLLAWRSRAFQNRTNHRWFLWSVPLAYVAIEFARTNMTEVFAGSWGMLPYALYDRPALLQPVAVTGIHGMTLLILLVNFALARVVLTHLDRRWGPPEDRESLARPEAARSLLVVGGVLVVWLSASFVLIDDIRPTAGRDVATVRVAAVQPDPYDDVSRDQDITEEEKLRRNIEQSEYAADLGAQLVVWYEAGLRFDPRGPEGAPVRDLADRRDLFLAAGWQEPTEGGRFNEVASFGPDGQALGSYGKSHPGEFAGDFSARQGEYLVYDTPFGTFGSIICFDLDFLDSARTVARLGAQILAVSSNDVPGIADKHYTHLVFRAIETRLAAVKADSAYDSAIIDPYGRVLDAYVNAGTGRTTLVGDVPLGTGDTLYVRFGDWFAVLAAIATAAFAVTGIRLRLAARRRTA